MSTHLLRALALVVCVGLAGCDSPSSPTAVNGLTLTSDVNPTTVNPGSTGTVIAVLRNVGNGATTINLSTGCSSLIRLFKYPSDESVPVSGGCIQVVVPVTLAPGEEYRQQIHVGSGTVTPSGTVLQPGEYYTLASSELSDMPDLRSRPVRFTIK